MKGEGGRWIAKLPYPVERRQERNTSPRGLSCPGRDSLCDLEPRSPLWLPATTEFSLTFIPACVLTWDAESQNDDQIVFVEPVSLQSQRSLTLRRFQEVLSCKGVQLHLWIEGTEYRSGVLPPVTAWYWLIWNKVWRVSPLRLTEVPILGLDEVQLVVAFFF